MKKYLSLDVVDCLIEYDGALNVFIGKNSQSRLFFVVDTRWKNDLDYLIINITPEEREEILSLIDGAEHKGCCWWDDFLFERATKPATFISLTSEDKKPRKVLYDVVEGGQIIIEKFLD